MAKIQKVLSREVFDSRGTPTVEADVILDDGSFGRAAVPSGASTGIYEAVELRDEGEKRLGGKGVQKAVQNAREILGKELTGMEADQVAVDQRMIELDGTENKGKLGANAILAVSMALSKAAAISQKKPLYEYFHSLSSTAPKEFILPLPMINVLNGGKHASKSSDFQEFMIMPIGAQNFPHAMDMAAEVFMALKKLLGKQGFATTVGDEGGFAPSLGSNQAALEKLVEAISAAKLELGKDVVLALDAAASEFYADGKYNLASENRILDEAQMIDMLVDWSNKYPIASMEDVFDQDAWGGYQKLTEKIGDKVQIVGDDFFVTNVKRLEKGIEMKAANAILIKLNQIGTVTETVQAIDLGRQHGYRSVVSHRSGETEDTTIADFVVGLGTGQIKTGSMSRSDRIAKYNQLLRINEELGDKAVFAGRNAFNK